MRSLTHRRPATTANERADDPRSPSPGSPPTSDHARDEASGRRRPGRLLLFTRMLVGDVARNRVVTSLLIVLMTLSVVLATASAGTLTRLIGASSSLMARADAPHVAQLHAGPYDQSEVDRWVAGRDDVAAHQTMLLLGIDGANLAFDGVPQTTSIQQNSLVVPNTERDLLLDLDDQPITEVEPGTIVLPVVYEGADGLEAGDPVRITAADGFVAELTIAGFARDSIMNPAITSSKRLAVAASDLERIRAHTGEDEQLIEFWLHDPGTQSAAFQKDYVDAGMPQTGQMVDDATFRILTMIGDGMVAAVIVLVSLLLLIVAALCLRFSFLTAAEQDYREIGVLKAIGAAPRDVRRIYLTKYVVLATVATILGLLGGWALTPPLTRNITRFMGGSSSVWNTLVPVLAGLSVLVALVLFVLVLLRRFRRISAVQALRSGATSQPKRAGRLRLHGSRMPAHVRLGAMDVIGRWPTYLLLFFVFTVSTFIVVVPVNSATTANAPDFIQYMGVGDVDVRFDLRHSDASSEALSSRIVDELRADPAVSAVTAMVTTRHDTVDRDGVAVSLYVENGDHLLRPLRYADGRAPSEPSEIALSLLALNQAGREIGDTLPITVAGAVRELTIVGSYQDITNGGRTAKSALPTDGEEVMWYVIGAELVPGSDATATAEAYGDRLAPAKVAAIEQWRLQTLGQIADQITVAAAVSTLVAISLAVLMTALFTRMLLARDTGQIAIQRAIGADDRGLRQQYLTRIVVVLVLGVVVGTLAANTLGERLFNLMFEVMFGGFETLFQGTSRIDFTVSAPLAYLALPAALLVSVTAATLASARSISHATIATLTTE
jgi:putative ABC transport system permease protein